MNKEEAIIFLLGKMDGLRFPLYLLKIRAMLMASYDVKKETGG